MIWKQDEKSGECFPTQDQYAFNLPFLYPWGNVSSHLTGSFCPPTLLSFILSSPHFLFPPAWLEFSMSSFWSSCVNTHHNAFCWMACFHTQSSLLPWAKEAKELLSLSEKTQVWILLCYDEHHDLREMILPESWFPFLQMWGNTTCSPHLLQAWSIDNGKALDVNSCIWKF